VLVDWFTVAAQVVNLLVLIFLLRRFLYGPITRAMAARQEAIVAKSREASLLVGEARAEGERLRVLADEMQQGRQQRLDALTEEVDALRREQLRSARAEVDQLQQRWQDAVGRERDAYLAELRLRAGEQILAVVRRAILDLSGEELDEVVVRRFVAELHRLDDAQRRLLAGRDGEQVIRVRTATPLRREVRAVLVAAIHEAITPDVDVELDTSASLISGVELRVPGFKLAWTVEDYLDDLETELGAALGEEPMADVGP
jgi:F-type H+-transporting ATPase subunit b